MEEFDLFDLVYIQNNQQYLQASSIHQTTMYKLFQSPINNNILKKNQHDLNKNRAVKLLNYSAKNYTDIKHGSTKSSSTSITSKTIPLHTAIFNKFIQELENQFTFSNYVSDVLTSNTFSALKLLVYPRLTNLVLILLEMYDMHVILFMVLSFHWFLSIQTTKAKILDLHY